MGCCAIAQHKVVLRASIVESGDTIQRLVADVDLVDKVYRYADKASTRDGG